MIVAKGCVCGGGVISRLYLDVLHLFTKLGFQGLCEMIRFPNFSFLIYRQRVCYSIIGPQIYGRDGGFPYSLFYKSNHCLKHYAPQWNKVS